MKELHLCITELRNAAQSLIAAADSLTEFYSSRTTAATPEPSTTEPPPFADFKEFQAFCGQAAKNGANMPELIKSFGASKLSEIPQERWAEFKAKIVGSVAE